eukprot:727363_1
MLRQYTIMCVSCHGCCQSMIKQGIFQYLERKNKQKIEVKALSPGEIETELEVKVKEEKRTNTIKQLSAPLHVGNLDNAVKSEQEIEKQITNHMVIGMSMAELQKELASAD